MNVYISLLESAKAGELILVDSGLCQYHLCARQNIKGQVTIHSIIVLPEKQRQGIAARMLEQLKRIPGATSIFAKCPKGTPANRWYQAMGFVLEGEESVGKSKTILCCWRFKLQGYQEKVKQESFF